ncbi:transformer-2 protein homolog alpha-like [Teleopsis dalmanni]|uniref:transformer-2 protein homolog alpha-like n=1 Tax=Teleopsis dalmanni TaxID=139649 RepID=UPI0018CDED5A|nr:transformer-2 protein homolog alpha-like [Teleopsis dalmanni]XP_037939628.1 transformer-2 protein homolog alpha-like [Teleopsis dalmanni]XP_037939629.1 transformer-2 protein homolog alpha-like [Teleopsis dalmanni]
MEDDKKSELKPTVAKTAAKTSAKRRYSDDKRSDDLSHRSRSNSRSRSRSSSSSRSRYRSRHRSRSRSPSRARSSSTSSSSGYYKRSRSRDSDNRSYSPDVRRSSRYSRSPRDRNGDNARVNPRPSRCVGAFGLSSITNESHLRSIFSKFGRIRHIHLVEDAKTGRSREFGFIYFKHLSDAKYAVQNCAHLHVHGRKVRIDFSISKRPHKPTPGVYLGRNRRERERGFKSYGFHQYCRCSSCENEREHSEFRRRDGDKKYDYARREYYGMKRRKLEHRESPERRYDSHHHSDNRDY